MISDPKVREQLRQAAAGPLREAARRVSVRGLPAGYAVESLVAVGEECLDRWIDRYDADLGKFEDWVQVVATERFEREVKNKRAQLLASAPGPDVVARQVEELRANVYGALTADVVSDVMKSLITSAKKGNLGAVKTILGLAVPKTTTVIGPNYVGRGERRRGRKSKDAESGPRVTEVRPAEPQQLTGPESPSSP